MRSFFFFFHFYLMTIILLCNLLIFNFNISNFHWLKIIILSFLDQQNETYFGTAEKIIFLGIF